MPLRKIMQIHFFTSNLWLGQQEPLNLLFKLSIPDIMKHNIKQPLQFLSKLTESTIMKIKQNIPSIYV